VLEMNGEVTDYRMKMKRSGGIRSLIQSEGVGDEEAQKSGAEHKAIGSSCPREPWSRALAVTAS